MQVVETNTEGLSREFLITIPAAEIEAEIESRLKDIGTRVARPGFRPGRCRWRSCARNTRRR